MQENKRQQPFTMPCRLRIACFAIWQSAFLFPVMIVLMLLVWLASLVIQTLSLFFMPLFVMPLFVVWFLSSIISSGICYVTVTSGWGLYCPTCGNKLFTIQQPASILAIGTIPLRYRLQMIHRTIRQVLIERRFTCRCCQTEYYVVW